MQTAEILEGQIFVRLRFTHGPAGAWFQVERLAQLKGYIAGVPTSAFEVCWFPKGVNPNENQA